MHNCYRAGKVHVMKAMCATCIYRPGNLMRLGPNRREQMEESAIAADSAIVCHSTLGTEENAVCRGFFNRHLTMPLRLAVAMKAIHEQEVVE